MRAAHLDSTHVLTAFSKVFLTKSLSSSYALVQAYPLQLLAMVTSANCSSVMQLSPVRSDLVLTR